jgi:hypothetical protein
MQSSGSSRLSDFERCFTSGDAAQVSYSCVSWQRRIKVSLRGGTFRLMRWPSRAPNSRRGPTCTAAAAKCESGEGVSATHVFRARLNVFTPRTPSYTRQLRGRARSMPWLQLEKKIWRTDTLRHGYLEKGIYTLEGIPLGRDTFSRGRHTPIARVAPVFNNC